MIQFGVGLIGINKSDLLIPSSSVELWVHDNVTVTGESEILDVNEYRLYSATGSYSDVRCLGIIENTVTYNISFEISGYVSGQVQFRSLGITASSNGIYQQTITSDGIVALFRRSTAVATDMVIKNISIKPA